MQNNKNLVLFFRVFLQIVDQSLFFVLVLQVLISLLGVGALDLPSTECLEKS